MNYIIQKDCNETAKTRKTKNVTNSYIVPKSIIDIVDIFPFLKRVPTYKTMI